MTAELLSVIVGVVLSLSLSYIPKLNTWYKNLGEKTGEPKTGDYQRLVMLGLLVLSAAAYLGLSCTSWGTGFGVAVSCDQAGAQVVIISFVNAAIANQVTYKLSPKLGQGKVKPSDRTKALG